MKNGCLLCNKIFSEATHLDNFHSYIKKKLLTILGGLEWVEN